MASRLRRARESGTLDLTSWGLTRLPPEVAQLTDLRHLLIAHNDLTELPDDFSRLTRLQTLDAQANQFRQLPPELTLLTDLRELNLAFNRLSELPAEVGQLARLQHLDLRGNHLTALPPELGRLIGHGLLVKLATNPLPEPFPELLARGDTALAAYLQSLADAIEQFEAKVMLVGEGDVGKSSLVAALLGREFIEQRPTTHGIEIESMVVGHPRWPTTMNLHLWDFGGQEVYRITHQFFFSRRSLYILVWNPRQGQEPNEVEAWLRLIRLRVGASARIIIVATHGDERLADLDYPGLQDKFPGMLYGQYTVDSKSGNGMAVVRDAIAIQAAELPHMGQLLSVRWTAVRDAIMKFADTEPQISFEQYAAVCEAHELSDSEVETLAELLHDLGQIIYYDDEGLGQTIVLNPEWLTKAIGYVLEDESTRTGSGVLDHGRLKEIWGGRVDGARYASRYHPYFLRLMEKFDISYRLEATQRESLVAQLVPHQRPALDWDLHTPVPSRVRRLALTCELGEPAPGLIPWLTVRHHRASTGKHWRRGVFLRHPIDDYASEALIELQDEGHLVVEVRAPSPDLFLNVLRDSVQDLIATRWPGMTYKLFCPCRAMSDRGEPCKGWLPLDTLLRAREKGQARLACWECLTEHDVSELLTGFAPPAEALKEELDRIKQRLERTEAFAADAAVAIRRVLTVVATEVTDCPRLFTITPERPRGMQRLAVQDDHYHLVLWCEHPGQWHPWSQAGYHLHEPKAWLLSVAPYASLVLKTLHIVVPVAISAVGLGMTPRQRDQAAETIELMKSIIEATPEAIEVDDDPTAKARPSELTPAQGKALRGMRAILNKYDPARAFGDLRRVVAPSGEILWVCPEHHPHYDPGLPTL